MFRREITSNGTSVNLSESRIQREITTSVDVMLRSTDSSQALALEFGAVPYPLCLGKGQGSTWEWNVSSLAGWARSPRPAEQATRAKRSASREVARTASYKTSKNTAHSHKT